MCFIQAHLKPTLTLESIAFSPPACVLFLFGSSRARRSGLQEVAQTPPRPTHLSGHKMLRSATPPSSSKPCESSVPLLPLRHLNDNPLVLDYLAQAGHPTPTGASTRHLMICILGRGVIVLHSDASNVVLVVTERL
jgi:hypothetical protein